MQTGSGAAGVGGWGAQVPHTITGTANKTGRIGDGKIDRGFNKPRAQLDIPRLNYLRGNSITFQIFPVFIVMCNSFSNTQKSSIQIISATLLNLEKEF